MNPLQKLAIIMGGLALAYAAACGLSWAWGRVMDKCLGPVDSQADPRPPAPAVFIGIQHFPDRSYELYNLTADIPDHPVHSTVSRETLERAGYQVPVPSPKEI